VPLCLSVILSLGLLVASCGGPNRRRWSSLTRGRHCTRKARCEGQTEFKNAIKLIPSLQMHTICSEWPPSTRVIRKSVRKFFQEQWNLRPQNLNAQIQVGKLMLAESAWQGPGKGWAGIERGPKKWGGAHFEGRGFFLQ